MEEEAEVGEEEGEKKRGQERKGRTRSGGEREKDGSGHKRDNTNEKTEKK